MALKVEIIRHNAKEKDVPSEVFLGKDLDYGTYDETWRLNRGKVSPNIVVFDPEMPGRGMLLHFDPNDRQKITAELPMPCSSVDIDNFIKVVCRIADYWDASIRSENGDNMPSVVFAANDKNIKEFNRKFILETAGKVSSGESNSFMLFGCLWPLFLGKTEADVIAKDPKKFDEWMIRLQTDDVFYAGVHFYRGENGPFGVYALGEYCTSVFPTKPYVPFGMTDGGEPLKCEDYRVCLFADKERIGEIRYEDLISKLPASKVSRYDEKCIKIEGLTKEEIMSLLS